MKRKRRRHIQINGMEAIVAVLESPRSLIESDPLTAKAWLRIVLDYPLIAPFAIAALLEQEPAP